MATRWNYVAAALIILVAYIGGSVKICGWGFPANYRQSSELVESSKKAIIETGFSEKYFDEHFRLVDAVNKTGDLRVVWRFSLNEYEAPVIDSIGYYTENQKRKYVHSIKNTLGSARDISKTIPRARAATLIRACVGKHADEAVLLMRLSSGEQASLYLTAHSVSDSVKTQRKEKPDQGSDKEARHQEAKGDQPETEPRIKRPPIYFGYINLETGKCTRGRAAVMP
jgi:hypothetical protein